MVDLQLLAAYFGPGGPWEKYGDIFRRVRRNRAARYGMALAACIGLFFVLTPVALLAAHITSEKVAASVFTPAYWIAAVMLWRAIVRSDKGAESRAQPKEFDPAINLHRAFLSRLAALGFGAEVMEQQLISRGETADSAKRIVAGLLREPNRILPR